MKFVKRSLLILLLLTIGAVINSAINIKLLKVKNIPKNSKKLKNNAPISKFRKTSNVVECDKGFGFDGFRLKEAGSKLIESITDVGKTPEYVAFVKPVIDKITGDILTEFVDFAVGDFKGKDMEGLSDFTCDAIPYKKEANIGTLALQIKKLPCPTDTSVTVCFTFSRCGSFGLSIDAGLPKCIATATGVGAVAAPVLGIISHLGFAFSLNNMIEKEFELYVYNQGENKFEPKTIAITGNVFFTLKLSLAGMIFPDSLKINDKKVSDLIDISGTINVIVNMSGIVENFKTAIVNQIKEVTKTQDASKPPSFIKDLFKDNNSQLGINLNAKVSFKLKDLTKDFLPDIDIAEVDFNIVGSMGGDLAKGFYIYIKTKLSFLDSFYKLFKKTIGVILKKVFDYDLPEKDLSISAIFALSIQKEAISIMLGGELFEHKASLVCIFRHSDSSLSCNGGPNIFTAIKEAGKLVVQKATNFFDKVGDKIDFLMNAVDNWTTQHIFVPITNAINDNCTCPPKHEKVAHLICYPECKTGYYGILTNCVQNCPTTNFRDDAYHCYKTVSAHTRETFFLNKSCTDKHGSCDKCSGLSYPKCETGYHSSFCKFCSIDCPPDMTDIGVSCRKKTYSRGAGVKATCKK